MTTKKTLTKVPEKEHVVMQLRKNITMNGAKPIKFADGSEHTVSSSNASKVLDHYASYKKPDEKEQFQKHIGSTHRELLDWIGGKKFTPGSASTIKLESRGVNNDEIFGHTGLRESSTLRTIKSLAHRATIRESKRTKFRPRPVDFVDSA
jgi:hypothetical protein